MPTIPVPQLSPSVQQSALPGARVDTNVNAEAFNAGQSAQGVSSAAMNLGGAVKDFAQQERDRADTAAHIQADTQASKLQTDIQVKVSQMKGQDAFGAQEYAEKAWSDGISNIRGGLNGRSQQAMFDKSASGRYESLNKTVAMHTSDQASQFEDQTIKSGIDQAANEAVTNAGDPEAVQKNVDRTSGLFAQYAKKYGIPEGSDQYKNGLTNALSTLHKDVIQARVGSGIPYDDLKEYFDKNKSQMSKGDILHTEGVLENVEVIKKSSDLFAQVSRQHGMKFNDGSINVEKARDAVMDSLDGMSDAKSEKVWSMWKARAREYNVDRNRTMQEHDRSFMNEVITARKNNQPLDQAMLVAGRYATDAYDQTMKAQAVQKFYAPPSKSDPSTYMALWESVQDGSANKEMIDQAMNKNLVNVGDWSDLRKHYFTGHIKGTDPAAKFMDQRVRGLADEKYGGNKQGKADFLYMVNTKAQGKKPEEKWNIAQDMMKDDPNSGSWFFNLGKDAQYQTDIKKTDAQNTEWGKTYDAIGYKQSMAIGKAVLSTGKPTWDRTDVTDFANQLGGEDQLKKGTPVNNAIMSLQAMNKRATPANVKALLEKFPEGKAPPGSVK